MTSFSFTMSVNLHYLTSLVGHMESGYIHCGSSITWNSGGYKPTWENAFAFPVSTSKSVSFNTAYSSPPHVQLSIVGVSTGDKKEMYGVDVERVDGQGFTMRCVTYNNADFRVYNLIAAWSSTAADVYVHQAELTDDDDEIEYWY